MFRTGEIYIEKGKELQKEEELVQEKEITKE